MATYEKKAEDLLKLAKAQFPDLTEAEETLFILVVHPDKWADYSDYQLLRPLLIADAEPEKLAECETTSEAAKMLRLHVTAKELLVASARCCKANYPADADQWGDNRRLKADLIRWLCTDKEAVGLVSHKGIRIRGARIDGRLDLNKASVRFPLEMERSAILKGIDIGFAHLKGLNLTGTHTRRIDGAGVRIDSSAFLQDGFKCDGGVDLQRGVSRIDLDFTGASLVNKDGDALNTDGMTVKGYVFMGQEFEAKGGVRLLGASIGGSLQCSGGKFFNEGKDKYAFNADGIKVKGSVSMDEEFEAKGGVRLLGASIGGNLQCRGGKFTNPSVDDGKGNVENRIAFGADRMTVKGDVFMDEEFEAKGEVRLPVAAIDGNLSCSGGKFYNPKGYALNAEQTAIDGHLYLDDGARVTGAINLIAAKITRVLSLRGLHKDSKCTLRLDLAHVGTLWDDATGWPKKGKLHLHGFQYDSLFQLSPHDAKSRIKWLRLQPEDKFTPQPYEQLAKVLREEGYEEDAKEVLIAKNMDRVSRGPTLSWPQWFWYHLLGPRIGYGHKPFKVWKAAACFVAVGWLLFCIGFWTGAMLPAKEKEYVSECGNSAYKSEAYPRFMAPSTPLMLSFQLSTFSKTSTGCPMHTAGGAGFCEPICGFISPLAGSQQRSS